MIHLSQKLPEYLKLTGTSTLSWHESGLGNTQCDSSGERAKWDDDLRTEQRFNNKRDKKAAEVGEKIRKLRERAEFIFQKKVNIPKTTTKKQKVPLIHLEDSIKKNH